MRQMCRVDDKPGKFRTWDMDNKGCYGSDVVARDMETRWDFEIPPDDDGGGYGSDVIVRDMETRRDFEILPDDDDGGNATAGGANSRNSAAPGMADVMIANPHMMTLGSGQANSENSAAPGIMESGVAKPCMMTRNSA